MQDPHLVFIPNDIEVLLHTRNVRVGYVPRVQVFGEICESCPCPFIELVIVSRVEEV